LFSNIKDDPIVLSIKATKIKLNHQIVEDPIKARELKNTLCIFDDYGSTNEDLTKALDRLRDNILNVGRHHNIAIINTNQILFEGHRSRSAITNASHIVLFPVSSIHQVVGFLNRYLHLDKHLITKIKNIKTRWLIIHRNTPSYILGEKIFMLL
jgi:hypothetical protein